MSALCPNGHRSQASDYCDTCGEVMGAAGGAAPASATPDTPVAPAEGSGDSYVGAAGDAPCPNCGVPNAADALFCEACGYDHTTGAMPGPVTPLSFPDALASPDAVGEVDAAPAATPAVGSSAAPGAPSHSAPTPPADAPAPESIAPALAEPWVAEVWIDPLWYDQQSSPDPLPSAGPPRVLPLRHTSLLIGRVSASRGITPDIDCGADNGVSRRHAQLTSDGTRWWVEDLGSSNGTFVAGAIDPMPSTSIAPGAKHEVLADDRIYLGSWTRLVIRRAAPGELD